MEDCVLCLIGDLVMCYWEDLVCMLCVVCLVVKLEFCIDVLVVVLFEMFGLLLIEVVLVCLFDELFKLFFSGYGLKSFCMFE